jgi:hypothetical protein
MLPKKMFDLIRLILVPRASRPRATFIGPGIHAERAEAHKKLLAVVSKAQTLELGPFEHA